MMIRQGTQLDSFQCGPRATGLAAEPVFIVGIENLSARPLNFLIGDVSAVQTIEARKRPNSKSIRMMKWSKRSRERRSVAKCWRACSPECRMGSVAR